MISRRRAALPISIVSLLIAELVLSPVPALAADTPDGDVPLGAAFHEERPAARPAAAPVKTDADDVSETGALVHQLPIRIPPGRNGAAPSLALRYSSDAALEASAFGAGWSVPLSTVRRSLRRGVPANAYDPVSQTLRYRDELPDGEPVFERDGALLVRDSNSPSHNGDPVFRDQIDRSFAKSIYHAGPSGYWLVIDRDGTQRFYGNVPDHSLTEAILRDERGTSAWLLVRSQDPFGNVVDYSYEPAAPGPSLQLEPLPRTIRYGKNLDTGRLHHAQVTFRYQAAGRLLRLDHFRGHVYLDRVATEIEVSLLVPSAQVVRTYKLAITPSPATDRLLLTTFQEHTPDGTVGPLTRLTYTDHAKAKFKAAPAIGGAIDNNVFRQFISAYRSQGKPWAPVLAQGWYPEWLSLSRLGEWQRLYSPPGVPHAFKLLDADGDGDTDILYHPSFAAGNGVPQPWASFLQSGPGLWQSFDSLLGIGAFTGTAEPDPLGMRGQVSEYADINGDGVIDPLLFTLTGNYDLGGADPTNPATKQVCNWWFEHAGGYTDPLPPDYPLMVVVPEEVLAAYAIDLAAAQAGIKDRAWSAVIGASLPSPNGFRVSELPKLQIGGVPGKLAYCYGMSANNPVQTPYLPNGPSGGGLGRLVYGPGELIANPRTTAPDWQAVALARFPLPLPGITIIDKWRMPPAKPRPNSLQVLNSNQVPVVDLDRDGIPELIAIKSLASGYSTYGTGVWRFRKNGVWHEDDDQRTSSRFTQTLEKVLFAKAAPSVAVIGDAAFDCGTYGPEGFKILPQSNQEKLERTRETLRQLAYRAAESANITLDKDRVESLLRDSVLADYVRLRSQLTATGAPGQVGYLKPPDPWVRGPGFDPVSPPGNSDAFTQEIQQILERALGRGPGGGVIVDTPPHGEPTYTAEEIAERIDAINPIPDYGDASDGEVAQQLEGIMVRVSKNIEKRPPPIAGGSTGTPGPPSAEEVAERVAILLGGGVGIKSGLGRQYLLGQVNWVTTFVDVNGDTLPDLVSARGATCLQPTEVGTVGSNHVPGFNVYLNRGDRFEHIGPDPTYAHGPFDLVRNWTDAEPQIDPRSFQDQQRLPFSTLAFTDLDADGTPDAVISAHVHSKIGAGWKTDPDACEIESLGAGVEYSVRCVWRGTPGGWLPDRALAHALPGGGVVASMVLVWAAVGSPGGRFDEATPGDQLRFADLDNDGIADLFNTRDGDPVADPNRVFLNARRRPDLLASIDNGGGSLTQITYNPSLARTGQPGGAGLDNWKKAARVPFVPWVVDTIATDSQSDHSDFVAPEVSRFTFEEPSYDFAQREFLGFRRVTERREVATPGGSTVGVRVLEREYFQSEQSPDAFPNPLKGLVHSETRRSDPPGNVESERTEYRYDVVDSGPFVRVVPTGSVATTELGPSRLTVTQTFSDFDDYDNPQALDTVATRQVNDGRDGTPITLHTQRTYQNDLASWILGRVATEVRKEGTRVLGSTSYRYRLGKLAYSETLRLGVQTGCQDPLPATIEERSYTDSGLLLDVLDNTQAHRHYGYDPEWQSLVATVTDSYTSGNQPAAITESAGYDYRFGAVATRTDANGHTTRTLYDALGRERAAYDADDVLVREVGYDLSARPTTRTTHQHPGANQPDIVRREYLDGEGRLRQALVWTTQGAIVERWRSYDSLGTVYEEAQPFALSGVTFVSRAALASPVTRAHRDVFGREREHELPDGRVIATTYEVGHVRTLDARQTPRDQYLDALGRVTELVEHFHAAGSTGPFVTQSTRFELDGDGHALKVTDADGNVREFSYDERGQVVRAEAPHKPNAPADVYTWCFDAHGQQRRSISPEGRIVTTERDELGRALQTRHEPSALYSADDATFVYDDPSVPNSRGRLTASYSALGVWSLVHDKHGRVVERSWATSLGQTAAPWRDGTFTSSTSYDRLGRALSDTLPIDPTLLNAPVSAVLSYDERGLPRSLSVEGSPLLGINEYTPTGLPKTLQYGNALTETRVYEPLSQRLSSSSLKAGAQVVQALGYAWDNDDNPSAITRTFGPGSTLAGPTINKTYSYDSLNRLQGATYTGVGNQPRSWTYQYSPGGNLLATSATGSGRFATARTYRYGGSDTHAVTTRESNSSSMLPERYAYDHDGQMRLGDDGSDGWTYDWNGDGQLARAKFLQRASGAETTLAFGYVPDGTRVRKSFTGSGAASWSDLYIGPLELRGSEAANPDQVQAYYDLDLGSLRAQLALRKNAQGRLERDPAADRLHYKDHLGSPILVTTRSGELTNPAGTAGRLEYTPYGEPLVTEWSVARLHQRFNGKELDETALSYYGARYAHPSLGRWLSRDPSALTDPFTALNNTQAANLYAFSDNNPATHVDPDGRKTWQQYVAEGVKIAGTLGPSGQAVVAVSGLSAATVAASAAAVTLVVVAVIYAPPPPVMGPGAKGDLGEGGARGGQAILDGLKSQSGGGGAKEPPRKPPEVASASDEPPKSSPKPSTLQPGAFASEGIPARGKGRSFSRSERELIDNIGKERGCHTCGTKEPGTKSGHFVPDHQPPNALTPDSSRQQLLPHCRGDSCRQGGEVAAEKRRREKP